MFLLIDNYDSFTYNLVQVFQQLGASCTVIRQDQPKLLRIAKDPDLKRVVISPGPGGPKKSGLCLSFLNLLSPEIPVLGVCLGHQILAYFGGCRIVRAKRIMHGKTSKVSHNGSKLFREVPNPFVATRYHSLLVDEDSIPECGHSLQVTARSEYREPMGLAYTDRPWSGIQFHPESILTPDGPLILKNFLAGRKQ